MNFSDDSPPSPQPTLQRVFAWLAARPPDDRVRDLAPLKHHLGEVGKASLPPTQCLKVLELFQSRIGAASQALKPRLIEARLPLQGPLRRIAQGLMDVHGLMAATLLRSIHAGTAGADPPSASDMNVLCTAILHNLAEQQQVALLVATAPPVGLWIQAQLVFRVLGASPESTSEPAAIPILKGMLALAAVQPETLTARENAILAGYLPTLASAVEITAKLPSRPDDWFWLEENRDLPPVAMVRKAAPAHGTMLYFSCVRLARVAVQHLRRLDSGELPMPPNLPGQASMQEVRDVLARAQSRWRSPPRRQAPRHPSHDRVQICARLDRLWSVLQDQRPTGDADDVFPITDWQVLNESSSGYAMMHVSGPIDDLVAGDILGVRNSPERPWNICLLRWGRSDNPAHVEIGLELVSPSAMPVQLAHHATANSALAPSLLLARPPGGDGDEALFVERGQLVGNRFTLIGEEAGKLRLAECEVQRLALQTARVEMFTFKRDYSPC
jgi:cyclic-di-GMP-binding protein